jgi:hypothetical protein
MESVLRDDGWWVQPCCCIYGTSTPERFASGISQAELQDGWLSRCLVFCSPNSPAKSRGRHERPVPVNLAEQVAAWWRRNIDPPTDGQTIAQFVSPSGNSQPPTQLIVPSPGESERLFITFDDETTEYGKEHPQLACLWAKGEENARRIALIVAAGESFDNPVITPAVADYACRLVRHLLFDFGTVIAPEIVTCETDSKKRRLLAVIEAAGVKGCVKRDLTRASQWANRKQRSDLLDDLVEAGEIAVEPAGKSVCYWTTDNFVKRLAKQASK